MTRATSDAGITRTRVETVPLPGRRVDLARNLFSVTIAYGVLLAGAALGRPWLFAVGAAVAVLGELVLGRRRPLGWVLGEVRLGPALRLAVRGLLAVTLLGRCAPGGRSISGAALGWIALLVLAAAAYGLTELITLLHKAPVLSRGLALGDLGLPPRPPGGLVDERTPALADLPLLVAVVAVAAGGDGWVLVAGVVVALAGSLALLSALTLALRRVRAADPRRRLPEAIADAVATLRPEVVLYHSGEPVTAYQVESWLRVVEGLGRPALVLLRDPATLQALAPTTLPVVCVPGSTTLVGFELPGARVALFAANGTGNIHLLRRSGIGFAFVGHGDSDKASSSTPFARVYDEVWVAGPAGRERYEREGARVRPEALVEVGRPQLAGLTTGPRTGGGPLSVLYAPTWEGWGEEPYHSSLVHGGVELVRRLLAEPDLRVVYRPHPLTGTRDSATRQAHRAVVDRLERAAAPHLVVAGRDPGLLDCFEASDLLVADVSAVVTDWLATGRPYAVLNPSDRPAGELHAAAPSTSAATLVGPELAELGGLLADLRAGHDPWAPARAELAAYLLGPGGTAEPFAAAVAALAARFSG